MPKAAIVGAGVGGLAVANLLAATGWQVDVFERHDQVGGRAGQRVIDGFTFDTGPSWYLMPEVFEHYYGLLDEPISQQLTLRRLDPAYQVFFDYRDSLTVRADLTRDAAMFEAVEAGAGARLQRYVAQADATYQLAVQHFLYDPFVRPANLAHPAIVRRSPRLLGLVGRTLDQHVRRSFQELALRQILEYPAVFLGASPFAAPAIYHLMSTLDFTQGVYYPAGGLYGIATSLHKIGMARGVRYHTNVEVEAIMADSSRARGLRVNGHSIAADIIISNGDRHFTDTRLLPAEYRPRRWRKTSGPSALLLYLGVRGALPQLQHHNLFFVKAWQRNFHDIFQARRWPERPSLYVCRPTASDPTVAPVGHENLFVLVPLPAGVNQPEQGDMAAYADMCLQAISQQAGIPDLQSRIVSRTMFGPGDFTDRFHAWQGSALGLSHTLGQSAFFRPSNRHTKVRNLFYVGGDSRPGIGLPMCLISAQLVFKLLSNDHSAGPAASLAPPAGGWRV